MFFFFKLLCLIPHRDDPVRGPGPWSRHTDINFFLTIEKERWKKKRVCERGRGKFCFTSKVEDFSLAMILGVIDEGLMTCSSWYD